MPMTLHDSAGRDDQTPILLSKRVEDASYYFLGTAGSTSSRLAVICGGWERCRPDYVVHRRGFHLHSLELVAAGRGDVLLAGRRYVLGPGSVFGYGPGIPHRIRTDPREPMTKYFIDFAGHGAPALVREALATGAVVRVSDPLLVRDTLDDLQRTALRGGDRAARACELLLRLLVVRISECAIRGARADERALSSFHRCRLLIEEQYLRLHALRDIAAACRLDPAYVCRLFQRFGNTSPCRLLLRQKMNHAADLLLRSERLVKEIAAELGFPDPFHFSRAFKRIHGLSPQQFLSINRRT